MACCCGVEARLVELLDSSTHSFIAAGCLAQPLLFFIGIAVAVLQLVLLSLVFFRAEGNLFFELAIRGLANESAIMSDFGHELQGHLPPEHMLETLGHTNVTQPVVGAPDSEGIARYNIMLKVRYERCTNPGQT